MRKSYFTAILTAVLFLLPGCGNNSVPQVIVYTALDQNFSEPILKAFETETGISCLAKFDTESTKTIGLVNALRAEAKHPRCDVFWNNEIVNTLRLQKEGLLEPATSAVGAQYPAQFRDPQGHWYGFAARARVLIVNTDLVAAADRPTTLSDFTNPKWKGKTAIAKPLFGSTATHMAVLHDLWGTQKFTTWLEGLAANDVQIHSGNRQSAAAVAQGIAAFGLTDTDDAMVEIAAGSPVAIVYPDSKPAQDGVLFIPNTLSVIKGSKHPAEARKLLDHLLSVEIEDQLALGPSAQIPLHPASKVEARVATPKTVHAMSPNWQAAADGFTETAQLVEKILLP